MTYDIEIPAEIVDRAFDAALAAPCETRGDLFHEVRSAFKKQIEHVLRSNGVDVRSEATVGPTQYLRNGRYVRAKPIIKYYEDQHTPRERTVLDIEFCAGYGHDDYSLRAINYLEHTLSELPSLHAFAQDGVFSIGNILVCVRNEDYALSITTQEGINITGYAYDVSKKKRKSYLCLFGVWFDNELLKAIIDRCTHGQMSTREDLDEVRFATLSFPILYVDRIRGAVFTCSCFDGYFDVDGDITRLLWHKEGLAQHVSNLEVKAGICHFCKGGVPKCEYGHSMYYSSFMQRYLPYHKLLSRMKYHRDVLREHEKDRYDEVENELRERFGYPKIGEGWLSETMLYRIVCGLLPATEVIHHYRGRELEGLELDIWLPDLRLGIEYQGEQHYRAVAHWGGEDGLKTRLNNDRRKKRLCRNMGYHLVEFRYDEQLTEHLVEKKLSRFIEGRA